MEKPKKINKDYYFSGTLRDAGDLYRASEVDQYIEDLIAENKRLNEALSFPLPLDRLSGQLANALRDSYNHDFLAPFLETGLNIIRKKKEA